MTDAVTIKLPKKLTGAALPAVLARLQGQAGPLVLDASEVARLGTDGAQMLVSAYKTCLARGDAFRVVNLSPTFRRHINDFSLTPYFEEAQV